VVCALAATALFVGQAALLGLVLDALFLKGNALAPLRAPLGALVLLALGRAPFLYAADTLAQGAAADIKRRLRVRLSRRLVERGPLWVAGERAGEVAHTVVGGVEALNAYYAQYLPQAVLAVLQPLLVLLAVFFADPLSAMVLFVTWPLIPLFMWLIGTRAAAETRRQWLELSRLGAAFLDAVTGLATLKALGRARDAGSALEAAGERLRVATLGVLRVAFLSALVLELLATLGTALLAVEIGLRLLYGRVAFASGLFVLVLTPEFYRPLRALGAAYHAGTAGREAGRRVIEVLCGEAPAPSPSPIVPPPGPRSRAADRRPAPRIALEDVRADYGAGLPLALDGVSLTLGAGQTLALVGPSGSGKSTVANLVLRFLDPRSGRVLVDGRPLSLESPDEWRARVAWVPQRPWLFHGTVLDNVRFGRPEATREEVEAAARDAEALDFIAELPMGFDTQVGEGGLRLSGGQARRLALARAFLKDAPVLVLDEPTAWLDPETEDRLAATLRRLCAGRTVLLIAHRLRTVAGADRVAILRAGRVEEEGPPGELRARGGAWARLLAAVEVPS
jgi:thiol reductant ABC exporter CydD subunit